MAEQRTQQRQELFLISDLRTALEQRIHGGELGPCAGSPLREGISATQRSLQSFFQCADGAGQRQIQIVMLGIY